MSDKKALLIIVEGSTDSLTLYESLKNYFNSEFKNLTIEITRGDIAYKEEINELNCLDYIKDKVKEFKNNYSLFDDEVVAIVQLIDTDGAFINLDLIEEKDEIGPYEFKNDKVYVNQKIYVKKRFLKKQRIYKALLKENFIGNIPYLKFYLSRNLEHALYDKINLSEDEKLLKAYDFNNLYKLDKLGFENYLKEIQLNIPLDYKESWDYILKDNNSMRRGSNLYLLLNEIKKLLMK